MTVRRPHPEGAAIGEAVDLSEHQPIAAPGRPKGAPRLKLWPDVRIDAV